MLVHIDWIALHCRNIEIIYFDSFAVHKEIEIFIGHKNIKRNIFRIKQFNNMWILLHWIH